MKHSGDDPTIDPRPTPSVTHAMHHLGSTQVASVITSAQLSSVRSAISGITAMIPPYSVQGKMNYSVDNATQMRVAIAQGYEQRKDLPQKQVEKFIADVIHIRTLTNQAFVLYAVNEIVEQEIMPLLNANKSAEEVTQKLCSLKISSDAAEKCVAYVSALQVARKGNAIPPSMPPDLIVDLKSELTALFNAGPKPVHGVPDSVRKGYESYLVALQNGEGINTSLAKYWLT